MGNVFTKVKCADERVKNLEGLFCAIGADSNQMELNKAPVELVLSLAEEEDYWRQKARIK